jgi:hypothetical protein
MSRRLLYVCLFTAAMLAQAVRPGSAAAKPPDLPINLEDTCAPEETSILPGEWINPRPSTPETTPSEPCVGPRLIDSSGLTQIEFPLPQEPYARVPGMLRPMVKRNLYCCLLFGVHPVLAMADTEQLIEDDEDEMQTCPTVPSGGSVLISGLKHVSEPPTCCCPLSRVDFSSCWTSFIRFWGEKVPAILSGSKPPSTCDSEGCIDIIVQVTDQPTGCEMAGVGVNSNSGLQGRIVLNGAKKCVKVIKRPTVEVSETPMDGPTCPYLIEQALPKQITTVDPQATRDVLTNLENLLKAEELYQIAETLRKEGHLCEALDCYELVSDLCPGSRYDFLAQLAIAEEFSGLYGKSDTKDAVEESEPATNEDEKPAKDKQRRTSDNELSIILDPIEETPKQTPASREEEIKKRLENPVNMSFTDTPLRQIIDDVRNWQGLNIYVDQPALEKKGISLDKPITFKGEQIMLRSALKLMLHSAGCAFVIKDEVLQIVPEKKATKKSDSQGATLPMPRGVAVQVRGLMKACRLALEAGRVEKAAELAREAFALDPERVAADPVIYKLNLLACPMGGWSAPGFPYPLTMMPPPPPPPVFLPCPQPTPMCPAPALGYLPCPPAYPGSYENSSADACDNPKCECKDKCGCKDKCECSGGKCKCKNCQPGAAKPCCGACGKKGCCDPKSCCPAAGCAKPMSCAPCCPTGGQPTGCGSTCPATPSPACGSCPSQGGCSMCPKNMKCMPAAGCLVNPEVSLPPVDPNIVPAFNKVLESSDSPFQSAPSPAKSSQDKPDLKDDPQPFLEISLDSLGDVLYGNTKVGLSFLFHSQDAGATYQLRWDLLGGWSFKVYEDEPAE